MKRFPGLSILSSYLFYLTNIPTVLIFFRLFGFKIHPMAYQIQAQAAANARNRAASARPRPMKTGHYK